MSWTSSKIDKIWYLICEWKSIIHRTSFSILNLLSLPRYFIFIKIINLFILCKSTKVTSITYFRRFVSNMNGLCKRKCVSYKGCIKYFHDNVFIESFSCNHVLKRTQWKRKRTSNKYMGFVYFEVTNMPKVQRWNLNLVIKRNWVIVKNGMVYPLSKW